MYWALFDLMIEDNHTAIECFCPVYPILASLGLLPYPHAVNAPAS
jgi:hypothetical protein